LLEIILIAAILIADQITKYLVQLSLSPVGTSLPLIDGVFHLTNVHNTGAAWGMMQGFRWLFIPMTLIVCGIIVFILVKYHKRVTVFSRLTLSLLFAGAVGNLIDRVLFGYVRDFFDFCLINFPVFNVADSAMTIGCALLIIDALFLKERSIFERVAPQKGDAKKAAGDGGNA
jgi:signal peptidase II